MEKKLHRSRDKRFIAGIAGGLGEYLDIDPIIIRIIIVLITIFHGIGLLIYIVMWIVVPEAPYTNPISEKKKEEPGNLNETINDDKNEASSINGVNEAVKKKSGSSNGRVVVGAILILVGAIFLMERFFPFVDFEFVFAVGLILLGLSILYNFFNKSEKSS